MAHVLLLHLPSDAPAMGMSCIAMQVKNCSSPERAVKHAHARSRWCVATCGAEMSLFM
jgi:hypothetical protein